MKRAIGLSVLLLCAASCAVDAPLPPMPVSQLESLADVVFVGKVVAIQNTTYPALTGEETEDSHVDSLISAFVHVLKRESKSSIRTIKQGRIVQVLTWKRHTRPRGWAGPTGQNAKFKRGQNYRFFATTHDSQQSSKYDPLLASGYPQFELLEPNGVGRADVPLSELLAAERQGGSGEL